MGISSGLYAVPLAAFLQQNSPRIRRGQILAATNFVSFSAMLFASLVFWVARSLLGESAGRIFLVAASLTVAVLIPMVYYLPHQIIRALGRLGRGIRALFPTR